MARSNAMAKRVISDGNKEKTTWKRSSSKHLRLLLNEQRSQTELIEISDRLYALDQALGRATHDVRHDRGCTRMLKKMIDEMELKSDLAKALVYRQNDDQMHFVIAELAEVAHCACMVALSETEAKAETVAAVISLPDYIAALKKCCSRAAF